MKKSLLLLLALLLAVSAALSACKNGDEPGSDTTPPADTGGQADGAVTPDVPEDYKIGGDFRVLSYQANVAEFGDSEAEQSDTVNDELIKRDFWLENRLGVLLSVDTSNNGQYADVSNYVQIVEQSVLGGMAAWDLIGTYSLTPPQLAQRGLLVDLQEYSNYLNTTKPWWPQYLVDACTINNRTYFLSGDISSSLLYNMQVVLFDVTRAAAEGLSEEDLYQMVYDYEWTLERMFELAEGMSQDDGNGTWDNADFYGITMESANMLDSFYFAAGLTTLNENEEGYLEISPRHQRRCDAGHLQPGVLGHQYLPQHDLAERGQEPHGRGPRGVRRQHGLSAPHRAARGHRQAARPAVPQISGGGLHALPHAGFQSAHPVLHSG